MGNKHKTLRLFILGSKVLSPPIAFLFIFFVLLRIHCFCAVLQLNLGHLGLPKGRKTQKVLSGGDNSGPF